MSSSLSQILGIVKPSIESVLNLPSKLGQVLGINTGMMGFGLNQSVKDIAKPIQDWSAQQERGQFEQLATKLNAPQMSYPVNPEVDALQRQGYSTGAAKLAVGTNKLVGAAMGMTEPLKNVGKKIVLYHGSNRAVTKNGLNYGTFLTNSEKEAIDYANMRAVGRGGKPIISKIEVSPDEVRFNQSTGEYQFIGKSKSVSGGKYPEEIYRALNDTWGSNMTKQEIDKLPFDEVRNNSYMGLRGGLEEFDKLIGTGKKLTSDPLLQEARKYKTAEEFVNSKLNEFPIGEIRIQRNIKMLNDAGILVKSPNDIITLYHGTNSKGMKGIELSKSLNPWSYLATDKEAAAGFAYGRNGGVKEIRVPVSELGYIQNPMAGKSGVTIQTPVKLIRGEDGIYRSDRTGFNTAPQLLDIWKKANKLD